MVLHPAMQDWRVIVGKNVRRIRQQRRMTQEKLAFEADLDLTYIGGIERGRRNPSLSAMARIAEALSVPLVKLLSEQ
ncbi:MULTISPECIES: helix-turn-helix domain-containing protein [Bradyrhizobium]|uniref:helix-turn-helix domain-containing protein n=1 Tax=Bradyrhizobium TaxID=374 RepID=UPI00155EB512|nr:MULTISPECIES: helix-turn-helix transcriptional regulator [Bradyrhizobium]